MGDLSKLAATGRSDVINGYVLSPPRLEEFAIAEDEFTRRYLRQCVESTEGLSPALREAIVSRVMKDLKREGFYFGTTTFDQAALAASNIPLMTWLCLRVKHPQIQRNDINSIIPHERMNEVAKAVWELWGYSIAMRESVEGGQSRPIDWRQIFKTLCGPKGRYSYEAVAQMTVPQLLNALGIDPDTADEDDVRALMRSKQFALFDAICEELKCTRKELLSKPLEFIVEAVKKRVTGGVPEQELKTALELYGKLED